MRGKLFKDYNLNRHRARITFNHAGNYHIYDIDPKLNDLLNKYETNLLNKEIDLVFIINTTNLASPDNGSILNIKNFKKVSRQIIIDNLL